MNRFILARLAAKLFGLATLGLLGGALICVIIHKTTLAGQLALGGVVAVLATDSMIYQMNKVPDDKSR